MNNNSFSKKYECEVYWEDFEIGEIKEFGNRRISEEEIIEFAEKYDPQRFHINKEMAEISIYKGIIASGWQTCSLVMRMMCDEYLLRSSSIGSPGLESIKWYKPVRPGDTLRVRSTVLEKRTMESKQSIGLVRTFWECLNQRNEVVTTIDGWTMFLKRPI